MALCPIFYAARWAQGSLRELGNVRINDSMARADALLRQFAADEPGMGGEPALARALMGKKLFTADALERMSREGGAWTKTAFRLFLCVCVFFVCAMGVLSPGPRVTERNSAGARAG